MRGVISDGRRLASGLYRVWSDKNSQKEEEETPTKALELRRLLDTYHDTLLMADYDLIWENIGNNDRYIAHSARIALENHGIEIWASRIHSDTEFNKKVAYALAVARSDNNLLQQQLFDLLSKVESKQLTHSEQLSILRAEALLMIRNNDLNTDALENQWLPIFPSKNQFINEELAALFSKTQHSIWVKKIMTLWSEIDEEHLKILISDSLAERSEMYACAVSPIRTRFFPAVELSRQCIEKGRIGTLKSVTANMGFDLNEVVSSCNSIGKHTCADIFFCLTSVCVCQYSGWLFYHFCL